MIAQVSLRLNFILRNHKEKRRFPEIFGSKKLEFQLVLWVSSSRNLLARGHSLLILVHDFFRGWLARPLAVTCRASKSSCPGLQVDFFSSIAILKRIIKRKFFPRKIPPEKGDLVQLHKQWQWERKKATKSGMRFFIFSSPKHYNHSAQWIRVW